MPYLPLYTLMFAVRIQIHIHLYTTTHEKHDEGSLPRKFGSRLRAEVRSVRSFVSLRSGCHFLGKIVESQGFI